MAPTATRAAQYALALDRETLVPAGFFSDLLDALDAVDVVPTELHELARRPHIFERP